MTPARPAADPGHAKPSPGALERLRRAAGGLLVALVLAVYLPSLPGDFLTYDDPWLVEDNPVLRLGFRDAVRAIFLDLGAPTRLALGAEYLPLRDLSYWVDRCLGLGPPGMRAEQLLLYVAAVLLVRSVLIARLPSRAAAEVASLGFALHPVHVESVAWIAGRKDVLALVFVAAALRAYEARGLARWAVVPLLAAAHFSKSMSIVAGGLLVAQDLLARRRPPALLLSACAAVALAALGVHHVVGERVTMVGGPLAGNPWGAWCTMGHVWLAYLEVLAWPPSLALMHEVAVRPALDLVGALGWASLAGGAVVGVLRWRRREPFVLVVWLWIVLPLAPVSQVLVPLQNVMADRYLWLSVLGVGLALAAAWQTGTAGKLAATAALGLWLAGSAWRATLFGDGVALFERETRRTRGPRAPYVLATTFERRNDTPAAELAYRRAIERPCDARCEPALLATNRLARLLVDGGRPEQAEPILRAAQQRFPDDAAVPFNLVKVLYRLGKVDEARGLFEQSRARFPDHSEDAARRSPPSPLR